MDSSCNKGRLVGWQVAADRSMPQGALHEPLQPCNPQPCHEPPAHFIEKGQVKLPPAYAN